MRPRRPAPQLLRPVALATLAWVVASSGCGYLEKPPEGAGARLALLLPADAWSPILDRSPGARVVQALFSRGYASTASDGSLRCEWARQVPSRAAGTFASLGAGTAEYRLTLREPARWARGDALTFEDFLFAYRFSAHPLLLPRHEAWVRGTKTVEVSRQSMRMVVARTPVLDFLDVFALPAQQLQGLAFSNPAGFREAPYHASPDSNGPFQITRSSAAKVLLQANPAFRASLPRLSWLEAVRYTTPGEALQALNQGTVDLVSNLPLADAQGFSPAPDVKVLHTPTTSLAVLAFNNRDAVLRLPLLRQAVAMAVRRRVLANQLGIHLAVPTDSWLPPTHAGYAPAFSIYTGNVAAARRLLQQAGTWKPGKDGRFRRAGRTETTSLLFDSENPVHRACATQIAADLAGLGIRLCLAGRTHAVYMHELQQRAFSMALHELDIVPWAPPGTWFAQESIPTSRNGLRGMNVAGYTSPANETLLKTLEHEACWLDARTSLTSHQQLLAREVPLLPLYYRVQTTAVRTHLQGVQPNSYAPITWNAEEWRPK